MTFVGQGVKSDFIVRENVITCGAEIGSGDNVLGVEIVRQRRGSGGRSERGSRDRGGGDRGVEEGE